MTMTQIIKLLCTRDPTGQIPLPAAVTHPVPGEHLDAVFVCDLDDSRLLDPGLSVHLHWHLLVTCTGGGRGEVSGWLLSPVRRVYRGRGGGRFS